MKRFLVAAMLASFGTSAAATTVDFEGLVTTPTNFPSPPGLTVGGLTFTTTGVGLTPVIRIFTDAAPRTDFLLACDFGQSTFVCQNTSLLIDFGAPIDSLSFDVLSVDNATAQVTAAFSGPSGATGPTLVETVTSSLLRNPVSFTGLGGVTLVEISNSDAAGVGFDDFTVGFSSTGGGGPTNPPIIPLPAGLPLLLSALGVAAILTRGRKGA